jgi:hypothetical protein
MPCRQRNMALSGFFQATKSQRQQLTTLCPFRWTTTSFDAAVQEATPRQQTQIDQDKGLLLHPPLSN